MPHEGIRAERPIAAALFALAIVATFPHVIFSGRSLLPSDNLNPFDYRLLSQNYGPSLLHAPEFRERGLLTHPNFHDIVAALGQAEPGLIFLRDSLRDGELPFWDPYTGAGAPALANLTDAFLFPPEVLLALAGATSTLKNLYLLLIFWVAGFATFIVLRQHGVRFAAAFAGGLAFMLSGALQQAGSLLFAGQAIAMMPVALAATHWFLDRPSWKRTAALSLLFAFVAQASFPPILLAGFGLVTVHVIVTLVFSDRERRRAIAKHFAAAVALSLGTSAFLYLPGFAALAASPHAAQSYAVAAEVTLRVRALFQLLSPTATGGKLVYENPAMNDYDQLFYIGTVALLLAVVGTARGRSAAGPLWWACVVTGSLTLLKMFGVPPVQWIAYLPAFKTIHFASYFGLLVDLIIALLAGIGLDRLMRSDVDDHAIAAAIAFIAGCLIGMWSISKEDQIFLKTDSWRWIADFQVAAIFATAGSLLLIAMAKSKRIRVAAGYAAIAALLIEGITNTTFPRQGRFDAFTHLPPYVREMQRLPDTGRYFTSKVLEANLGSAAGVRQVDSLYNFQLTRLFEIYQTYTAPPASKVWHFLRDGQELPPDPVLDRMNVGYVAVRPSAPQSQKIDDAAQQRGYPVAWQDSYARIYVRPTLPRAQFTSAYQVTTRQDALRRIGSAPADRAILEARPDFPPAANQSDDPKPRIIHAMRNHITVGVQAPRRGLLVLADTWFPGWTAKVNGRPVPILVANYAFRAVAIPAGPAAVEFDYWPNGLTAGLVISAVSLILTLICFFVSEKRSVDDTRRAV